MQDRVDIVTGTLGKALGGASGGYTAARGEIVEMLRQRSRPYLFSNSLAPSIAAAAIATLDLLGDLGRPVAPAAGQHRLLPRRDGPTPGSTIPESDHPIVPVMIGDAVEAAAMADRLLADGIYVRRSPSPWCRAARPGSGPRCRRPTPRTTSTAPSPRSSGLAQLGLMNGS